MKNPLMRYSRAALWRELERRESLAYQRRVSAEFKARREYEVKSKK